MSKQHVNQLREMEQLLAAIEERQNRVLHNFDLIEQAVRRFVDQLETIEEDVQKLPQVEYFEELAESARDLCSTLESRRT